MRKKNYFIPEQMTPQPIEKTVERRVLFSEVDVLGIVWHGRYPQFFEEAHTILFHHCNLTYEKYRMVNLSAPIVRLEIDYMLPLYLDEIIKIRARLFYTDAAKLLVDYQITNSQNIVTCTGCTTQIFVDTQSKEPLYLSPEIWENCRRNWRDGVLHG
jgi:acyl-CoA thioester hydrolase